MTSNKFYIRSTFRFFFLVETELDRLDITVTPCASPIIWQVTHKPKKERQQRIGKNQLYDNT